MLHSNIDPASHLQTKQLNNQWIISCDPSLKDIEPAWFSQEYWMNQGRLLGANSGRGSAWVIKTEWGKWVLRHYFRGGLYAKINKDRYFWVGLEQTRAYRELNLLNQLQQWQLPSPRPVGALISKSGLFYRNDLIMSHLPHEMTWAQALTEWNQQPEKHEWTWRAVGQTIARYHHHGVYHSDLNAHNILINQKHQDSIQIIDFDKGSIKKPHRSWHNENLMRLKRSIEKVTGLSCEHELAKSWQQLHQAYHQAN